MVGAASNGSGGTHFRTDSPAGRAHLLTRTAPQAAVAIAHDDPAPQPREEAEDDYHQRRRRLPLVKSALVILVVLVVGAAYAGWRYTQSQYYVAVDGGQVAIFRGINQSAAGMNLSSVARRFDIPVAGLPASDANTVRATIMSSTGMAGAAEDRGQHQAGLRAVPDGRPGPGEVGDDQANHSQGQGQGEDHDQAGQAAGAHHSGGLPRTGEHRHGTGGTS